MEISVELKSKVKYKYSNLQICLTTKGIHVPYGIIHCYLPPYRGDFPNFTPADLVTLEGCKAELT